MFLVGTRCNASRFVLALMAKTMADIPNRQTFENAYAGKAPWDIGKPQTVYVRAADKIHGSILDAGCGTGENALFFAQRGHKVTGVDYLPEPIERAKKK